MTEQRGRQSRQEEMRTERRRRDDTTIDAGQARKLAIPPHIEQQLAAQGRTPRWINVEVDKNGTEIGSRVQDMTVRDDWDMVEGVAARSVLIDKKNGTMANAYLVSKPNSLIAQDRAKKDAARREREAAMLNARVPGATAPPEGMYADKANKIERGNQIL